jgi:CDP-diacylglycerol--serine O-phosphatidyltransferase
MKKRRKKRPRDKKSKGIFLLPNLFTSASLFGGFYAIIAAIHGRYEAAAVAIIISGVFDGLDGRIARFTHTTSPFGTQYDSLSDLVAFGVAPGILAYSWAMEPFGRLGWLAAFMYVICGALRLARFNVQTNAKSNTFKGLPIPAAACVIATLILFTHAIGKVPDNNPYIIIFMMYALSFLMVSSIDYLSFKEFHIRDKKPFNVLVSVILIFIVIAYKPKIMLFLIALIYVLSGPIMTFYRWHGRRYRSKEPEEELLPDSNDEKELNRLKDQEITR